MRWIPLMALLVLLVGFLGDGAVTSEEGAATAALTVNPEMLVQGEDAMAKMVTGSRNPDLSGLLADEESAGIISTAVSMKYPGLAEEAVLTFAFETDDIDDRNTVYPGGSAGDDVEETEVDRGWEDKWLTDLDKSGLIGLSPNWDIKPDQINTENFGVWFDADGDGEVNHAEDYPVYNDIFFVRKRVDTLTIKSALRLGSCEFLEGKTFEIMGQGFYLKDFDANLETIDILPIGTRKPLEGYDYADIGDDTYWPNECRFWGEDIEIPKGGRARLGKTDTFVTYSDDEEFDIVKLEVGGLSSTPARGTILEMLKDSDVTPADLANFNLFLVGGPIANSLTADLVDSGASEVNWELSEGEIEVLSGAFAVGRFAIIVAGKDRDATKNAATSMAALV
jgi:hypothetical protein